MKDFEYIKKYAGLLAGQEYPIGDARLIVETAEGVFATKAGADLADLAEADVEQLALTTLTFGKQEIKAVVFSQTPYCQQWLGTGKTLIPSLDDMAQIIGPDAKLVILPKALENLETTIETVIKGLGSNAGCFVADGGQGFTFTVGRSPYEAVTAMTVLEKSAEVTLLAQKIGKPHLINGIERRLMRFVYRKKYSKAETKAKAAEATAGAADTARALDCSPEELALRQDLVDYGKKLVATGLVQGTWGNISARFSETEMLVTPSGLDYTRLTPADMVKVNIETLEYEGDLKPTSEKALHAAIYKQQPDAGAVIHTHSKYCCVYAAARRDLDVRDASLQAALGSQVRLAAYGLPGTKKLTKNTAAAVGTGSGAIMSNHGMIVRGSDLEDAFHNCEKMEAAALANLTD